MTFGVLAPDLLSRVNHAALSIIIGQGMRVEGAVCQIVENREFALRKLKTKWESACANYEAAWNSRSEKSRASPWDALAELISVKVEIDSLVAAKGTVRQESEGPFVVGIINLSRGQLNSVG